MTGICGKIWGQTELILKTSMIEVHRIMVLPDMQCSTHMHEHKWNGFYCLEGNIDIIVQKKDYDLTDITSLSHGVFTAVKPGEFHKFRTGDTYASVLEIYWLEGISEDIIRQNCGGLVESEQIKQT